MKWYFSFLALISPFAAKAFYISSDLVELNAAGRSSSGEVRVINDGDKEVDISIFISRRGFNEFGEKRDEPYDIKGTFLIFPSHAAIKPKSSVVVRVVYIGSKKLDIEQAYKLTFIDYKPHPLLNASKDKVSASVDAVISYGAAVYVGDGKKLIPKLTQVTVIKVENKEYLKISNEGTKRISVAKRKILVSSRKDPSISEIYVGSDFKELQIPILAQTQRIFKMPEKSKIQINDAVVVINEEGI